jgi:hypothetical protein
MPVKVFKYGSGIMRRTQSGLPDDIHRAPAQGSGSNGILGVCCLCLAAFLSFMNDVSGAYGGPAGSSPIGSATLPPSSYEGGLFTNPNPFDSSGNLLVTGNVRGGKHFRGSIPYNSPTSFGAPLGSTRLDSFMRYSAIPQELGDYRPMSGYDSFYSPTGTVSQIRPGQAGVSAPTSPRAAGGVGRWRVEQPTDIADIVDIIQPRLPAGRTNPGLDVAQMPEDWSASRLPEQMRQIVSDDPVPQFTDHRVSQPAGQPMTPQEYQQQLDQFRAELERIKAKASQLEQSLAVPDSSPQGVSEQVLRDTSRTAGSHATLDTAALTPDAPQQPAASLPDLSALMRQIPGQDAAALTDAGSLSRAGVDAPAGLRSQSSNPPGDTSLLTADAATRASRIAEIFHTRGQEAPGQIKGRRDALADLSAPQRVQETAGPFERLPDLPVAAPTSPAPVSDPLRSTPDDVSTPTVIDADEVEPKHVELPAASWIPARPADLDPASKEKFDRYMKVAESYSLQGRYDRAAASYALASVCNPSNPHAHLGRSWALLAMGDFKNSTLFVMKAIDLDAATTLAKVDLVNLIGGPDLFVQRVTDLEQRAEQASAAPEQQFLLAYIYYQMDRPAEARAALAAASKALPYSRPVTLFQVALNR